MYFKNDIKKFYVKKFVEDAVKDIKILKNYGFSTNKVKHGDMEADIIHISVYKKDLRRGEKRNWNPENDNFICNVQYDINKKFLIYLKEKSAEGKTIIISSHDINLLEKFCDKILFLKNGSLSFWGNIHDFVDNSTIKLNFSILDEVSQYQIDFLESYRFKVFVESNSSFIIEVPIDENILDIINEIGKIFEITNFSTAKSTLQESYLKRIGGEK